MHYFSAKLNSDCFCMVYLGHLGRTFVSFLKYWIFVWVSSIIQLPSSEDPPKTKCAPLTDSTIPHQKPAIFVN